MSFQTILSKRAAAAALLVILTSAIVFHLLIVTGIVPFAIVWGGKLQNTSEMRLAELVSIAINVLFLTVAIIKVRNPDSRILIVQVVLWIMAPLFLLNTLGNLFSLNTFERWFFTPLTLLLSVLSLRLALRK